MLYTRWFGSFTAYHTSPIYVHSPQSWFGVLHLLLLRKSDIGKTIVILWVVRVMVCAAARRALRVTLKDDVDHGIRRDGWVQQLPHTHVRGRQCTHVWIA